MSPTLQEEIRQSKPFASLREQALLNILRTAAVLAHRHEQFFRELGITSTQYNVLRIVAGAGPDGLGQCDIAERLVTMNADVPRLLKRTEVAGLIERSASPDDKRVLKVQLTPLGVKTLEKIAPRLAEHTEKLFPSLTLDQLAALNDLLDAAR
jgi:MarR family 2-MHQ and catechol resistance regulon transcriptional repressor